MTDFPILDASRDDADRELGRTILRDYGFIEPLVAEMDDWVSMPVRLVHDQAGGFSLEVGPYTLDGYDIRRLREAIRSYDTTLNGPSIRRIQ